MAGNSIFDLARRGAEARAHSACPRCKGQDLQDEVVNLKIVLLQLLEAIEPQKPTLDSFERQYHCGELEELLDRAFKLTGRPRPGR